MEMTGTIVVVTEVKVKVKVKAVKVKVKAKAVRAKAKAKAIFVTSRTCSVTHVAAGVMAKMIVNAQCTLRLKVGRMVRPTFVLQ